MSSLPDNCTGLERLHVTG